MSDKSQNAETSNDLSESILAGLGKQMVETSPSGMILVDASADDMPIVYVNAAFETLTGYASDEIIGYNCRFLQGNERNQPDLDILRDAIQKREACTVTLRNYRKDGTLFWNELHISPLFSTDGQVTHFVGVQNDVTEREEALDQLKETSANLRAILDSSSQSFTLIDRNARVIEFDRAGAKIAEDVFGKPLRVGEDIYDYVLEHDIESFTTNFNRALAGETVTVEKKFDGQDTTHYLKVTYYPVSDMQGVILGTCMSTENITERKQIEEELRAANQRYNKLVSNLPAMIYRLHATPNMDFYFDYLSPNCYEFTGYTAEEGMRDATLLHSNFTPADLEKHHELTRTSMEKLIPFEWEGPMTIHGKSRWVHIISHPKRLKNGDTIWDGIHTDITERKQMEDALRDSEYKYRNLFENAMHEVHLWKLVRDEQGAIKTWQLVEANPAALKAWGKNRADIIGKTPDEVFLHNATEQFMPIVKKIFSEGMPYTWEAYFPPTGEFLYMTSVPFGEYFISTGTDITERKQMEDALRESEQKFRTLTENSPDNIQRLDRDGKHLYVNAAYAAALSLPVEQIIGKTNQELGMPAESIAFFAEMRERVYTSRQPVEFDFSYSVGDEMRYFNTRMIPEFDSDGNVVCLLSVSRDITERKRMEEALARSEALYRLVTENVSDGISLHLPDGRYIYVNQAGLSLSGYSLEELKALTVEELSSLVHPDDLSRTQFDAHQQVLAGGEVTSLQYRYLHKDGHYVWVENNSTPIFDENNEVEYILSVQRDITQRLEAEEHKLTLKLERERRRLLSSFIEGAAHEFRTPLATINSSAYLMSRSDDPDRRAQKAKQVEGQVKRITRLVDSLLLMTRLESKGTLASRPVDPGGILQSVCAAAEETCARDHQLTSDIAPNLPSIMGDADYLNDAFQQIIDNACRFTPEGGKIDVQAESADEHIWIEIRDSGPGIADDDLPHIFETFWRQDAAHRTPGFGLGLPIAQKIIQRYGGEVAVESEVGQGTTVRVTLPTSSKD